MTRSEEELAVGKRPVEAGRVRLRKYVETEHVERPVQVTQPARVERRGVERRPAAGDGEDETEVTLRAEEPVEKRVVPKEQVTVTKDTERRGRRRRPPGADRRRGRRRRGEPSRV